MVSKNVSSTVDLANFHQDHNVYIVTHYNVQLFDLFIFVSFLLYLFFSLCSCALLSCSAVPVDGVLKVANSEN